MLQNYEVLQMFDGGPVPFPLCGTSYFPAITLE